MLKRLLSLREFCESFEDSVTELNLTDDWMKIENLVEVLEPANEAMIKFQYKDLIFPEFYKIWVNALLKLDKCNNKFAKTLHEKISERFKKILTPPMLSSLYLHPRYDFYLIL